MPSWLVLQLVHQGTKYEKTVLSCYTTVENHVNQYTIMACTSEGILTFPRTLIRHGAGPPDHLAQRYWEAASDP
jgi:hypothetical protein